ncbi:S8 family serine peptidase [Actinopolymorpha sp. B9G3]|uniref:S8 family serine peptidase n=1 Tax=Actinopolymorpha sp. B9G3 TaxID=3158970 RepID=UPI0032D96D49
MSTPAVQVRGGLLLAVAAILLAPLLSATDASAGGGLTITRPQAPEEQRRVIIELAGAPAMTILNAEHHQSRTLSNAALRQLEGRRGELADQHQKLDQAARSAGIDVTEDREFSLLFNGVAARVPAGQVERLRDLPGVRVVHDDATMRAALDVSVPHVGAPELWRRTDPTGARVTGKGVTVAVIDTGIDYTHPALGGGFGPGHKVIGGHDLVANDADPMDQNGHGTHVAATIAGSGSGGGGGGGGGGEVPALVGVAPDAHLTAYRVLNAAGSGAMSQVLAGLEAAVDPASPHRADVVNLSVGGPGDGTDPLSQASNRATDAGVVVVASAGNNGPGPRTIGSPAAAANVIAVGASATGVRTPALELTTPERETLQAWALAFSANAPAKPVTAGVVDLGSGEPADLVPEKLRDKLALIHLRPPQDPGPDPFETAKLAESAGAVGVVFHPGAGGDQTPGPLAGGTDGELLPRLSVGSGDDGRLDRLVALSADSTEYAQLRALLAQGTVRVRIVGLDRTDTLASFSSRGPNDRYHLKPDLVAPGVQIRSAYPTSLWEPGVARLSGTSMAAPHVAAGAALLRQLHPDRHGLQIRSMLVGSARLFAGRTPTEQGAGLLDLPAAATSSVLASPATLSLGLADLSRTRVTSTGQVTVTNTSANAVQLELRGVPAGSDAGSVRVAPNRVTLPAGGSAAVTVTVSGERRAADTDLGGWIEVDAPGRSSDSRVPYLLAVAPLHVFVAPDPSEGPSEVFAYTPVDLSEPPTVTVHHPGGDSTQVGMVPYHARTWRAAVTGPRPGTYDVDVSAVTTPDHGGVTLAGSSAFEVLDRDAGGTEFEPVGPHGDAGPLAFSPAAPDQLVALGNRSIWVSPDRGRTWTQRGRFPALVSTVSRPVVDPTDGKRMWLTVSPGDADFPVYNGKLLRTDDGGRSWTQMGWPDGGHRHVGLAIDDTGRVLVAHSSEAVHVSHDQGAHWATYPAPAPGVRSVTLSGADLYVATNDGLWLVRDITGTPQPADRILTPASGPRWISSFATDGTVLVAAGFDTGVLVSTDGGQSWRSAFMPPTRRVHGVWVADGVVYVASYSRLFVGRDHGTSWTEWENPVPGGVAAEVGSAPWSGNGDSEAEPDADADVVVSISGAGVYVTDDGGASYRRLGFPGQTVYDLAIPRDDQGRDVLVAGTIRETHRTPAPTGPVVPETLEWGTNGAEGTFATAVRHVAVSPQDPRTLWKVRPNAVGGFAVERSDDAGGSWKPGTVYGGTPTALLVHPADPRRVDVAVRQPDGVYFLRTKDNGATWKRYLAPGDGALIHALAGDPRRPDRIWIGGDDGLWRSDDGGETATRIAAGTFRTVLVDSHERRVIAGGDRVLTSEDNGKTWRTGDLGSLPTMVNDLITSPRDPDTIYAASGTFEVGDVHHGEPFANDVLWQTGRGVLRSKDGGRTWANVSAGLQNTSVRSLAMTADGGWLFAGTDGGGVHRLQVSSPR